MRYRYRYDFMRVLLAPQGRKQQQQEGMEPRAATAQVSADFSFFKRRQNISMLEFSTIERDS